MAKISGILSEDARIIVLEQSDASLSADVQKTAGAYEIDGLVNNGDKIVIAKSDVDGGILGHSSVTPELQNLTIQKSVAAGGDDGWYNNSSHWHPTEAAIYVYAGAPYYGWARFTGLNVGQGQSLISATLRVYFEQSLGSGKYAKIYCNDADNATAPTSRTDAYNRTRTTAYVQPTLNHSPVGGYADINVITPVQEVINRGGWGSGNAMLMLMDPVLGAGSASYWYLATYESVRPAPRLTLVFEG